MSPKPKSSKKKDDEVLEILDLPADREQRLAKNFTDPALDGIFLDPADSEGEGVVQETSAAVQELVQEALPTKSGSQELFGMEEQAVEGLRLTERWEMANKLFQFVSCEKSFDRLVEDILSALMQAVNAQAGSVLELDSIQQNFFFRASVGGGDPEQIKAFRVPCNKGIVGHVAESRQTVLLKNLKEDRLQLKAISTSTGFETVTCLSAPLIIANQLYGVVELFNKKEGGSFDEKDARILEDGVRMAGKVLEVRFLAAELARMPR